MFDDNKIIAVDLGSSHITLMAAEIVNGEVNVLAVEKSQNNGCVHNGIIENPSGVAFQISKQCKELSNSLHWKEGISSIYVSVNAKTMKCVKYTISRSFRNFTEINSKILSEMEKECCNVLAQNNMAVYYILPIDYKLDDKRFAEPPVKHRSYNVQVTYNVVIGNKIIGEKILGIFERTKGITFKEFKPLAIESLAKAVLSQEDCYDGVALINIGATTTTLAFYANGILETLMVVPLGSYTITKDIQELGMSESYAEKLKCLKGIAMETMVVRPERIIIPPVQPDADDIKITTPFLAKIIEARLDEIFMPIFEELKKNKNKIGAGIVLTGGGSNLNGIVNYIQKKTDIYIRFGSHTDKLTKNTDEQFTDPVYAQIIGTFLLIDKCENINDTKISWKEKFLNKIGKIFDDENPL